MKLATLTIYLLSAAGKFVDAIPTNSNPQANASRQITEWQTQYNHYIEATIKTRKTGCTSENIVYRQEW